MDIPNTEPKTYPDGEDINQEQKNVDFIEDMESIDADDLRNKTRVHPIDPRELTFGSIISASDIERPYNVSRHDYKEYNLARLQMRNFIERMLPDILGTRVFVKNAGDGLRILPPSEVPDEMERRTQKAVSSIRKSNDVGTDTASLPDLTQEERTKLHQQLAMSSIMRQAYLRGLKAKRNLLQKPVEEHKPFLTQGLSGEITPNEEDTQGNES
ncbi:MAG TPA: hypothetical protein EYQ21_04755 [Flavobacteriales bacterium]|nr:hypothetical protein [Flavobacteriales bacterium]